MDRTPGTQKIEDRALQELSNDVFTNEIRTHMKDKIWIWRSISLTSVMRRLHNSADKESLFWPPADQQFLFSEDSNDDHAALWTLPPSTLFDVALRPVREPSIGVGHPFKVGENEDFEVETSALLFTFCLTGKQKQEDDTCFGDGTWTLW